MSDIPALVQALESTDAAARLSAAEQLARLDSDAQPAAIALVQALDSQDQELRDWAVAALEAMGPPAKQDVAKLSELVVRPELDSAYWAATLLGRLQEDAAAAIPSLITVLETHPDLAVRERAAWALGKIGSPATAAKEILAVAAASSEHARLARLAQEALKQIES